MLIQFRNKMNSYPQDGHHLNHKLLIWMMKPQHTLFKEWIQIAHTYLEQIQYGELHQTDLECQTV